jgi:hypothetical protein
MRYLWREEQKIRRDKVCNQTIRMALNVNPLQSQIQQMQLCWFGHVVRVPESRYPCMAWEARYEGRRTRGRLRTKWQDSIQSALLEKGVDWRQARSRAQDRKRWHSLCQTSTCDGRRGLTKWSEVDVKFLNQQISLYATVVAMIGGNWVQSF